MLKQTLALILLWPAVLFGQANAVIDGPDQVKPGDLVVLDGSESLADDREWILVNSDKQFLSFEHDQKLVFASGTPGEYVFILAVSLSDANGSAVSVAQHVVTVGKPDPGPDDPDDPDEPDLTDIGLAAKAAVERGDTRPSERSQISKAFQALAGKAAGLASMTVEQIAGEASRSVKAVLLTPSDQQRWAPFRDWFAKTMQAEVTDRETVIRLLDEVAAGIEAARDGTSPGSSSIDVFGGLSGDLGDSGDAPTDSLRGRVEQLKDSTQGLKRELDSIAEEIGR